MKADRHQAGRGIPSLAQIFFGQFADLFRARRAARRHGRRPPQLETLEPRILLSADLVGSVEWAAPAAPLIPGDDVHASVVVRNVGDQSANPFDVRLYASADAVLDASDLLLDSAKVTGGLRAGNWRNVGMDFELPDSLRPGEYQLLAMVDPENKVKERSEANNVSVGPAFGLRWMFGDVPGHHGDNDLSVRDADGTRVHFELSGPGSGEVRLDGSQWDVVVTGSTASTVLTITTDHGGNDRVSLDDIQISGPLQALVAPTMDLTGTLAISGAVGAGLLIGSADGALISAPSVQGLSVFCLTVQGIAVLGDLTDSQIRIGGGNLGDLLIGGEMDSSRVSVGQNPVDGIYDNGNDTLSPGGAIRSVTILDEMSADSRITAASLPAKAIVDGHQIPTANDLRFVRQLGQPAPSVSVGDAQVVEGNTGTRAATFTVTLSNPSTQPVQVAYSTANGTALAGSDYNTASGVLTFAPGEVSKTIAVQVLGDTEFEGDETFRVDLSNPVNALIADDQGIGTILNDDVQRFISIGDVSLTEGNTGTSVALFHVTLSGPSSQTVAVNFATADGTAAAGSDYNAASGVLVFAPGETSKTIAVQVLGDTVFEGDETFRVDLSSPINALIAADQAIGTILNDDVQRFISIGDVSLTEGNTGTSVALFHVTLSGPSSQTVAVNFATANGTAEAGSDYNAASGVLTFAPGETSKAIAVQVLGDVVFEADEIFAVDLSSAINALIADDEGIGRIINDDSPPVLRISDASVAEGDNGSAQAVFTVDLTGATSQLVIVNFSTADGTGITGAQSDSDYVANSGTLIFQQGETTKQITVSVNADGALEADETFFVNLLSATNAAIGDGQGVGTILSDDFAPVAEDDSFVTEEDTPLVLSSADLTANDSDADGDSLTVTAVQAGPDTHGTVTLVDGVITYTPDPNYNGPASFTYTVGDGQGGNDEGLVALTVGPVNDAPVAVDDNFPLDGVVPPFTVGVLIGNVLANDTDSDGDELRVALPLKDTSKAFDTDYGSLTLESDGDLFWSIEKKAIKKGDKLQDSGRILSLAEGEVVVVDKDADGVALTYTVTDAPKLPGGDEGAFQLTITGVNDAPEVAGDSFTTYNDTALVLDGFLETYAFDWDHGDTLSVAFGDAAHGTVAYDSATDTLTYAPNPVYAGGDSFEFTVTDSDGATASATVDLTILASTPTLAIGDVTLVEGDDFATTTAVFTVTLLNGRADQTVAVAFNTTDGTASAFGANINPLPDYEGILNYAGALVFEPGVTQQTISVSVYGDSVSEGDQWFFVNLFAPTNASLGDGQGRALILDDDPLPEITVDDVSVLEGDGETRYAEFHLHLSQASEQAVSVGFATADRTATEGEYVPTSGTLVLNSGQIEGSILVEIVGDTVEALDRSFYLNLGPVEGAVLADQQALGTILDDDGPVRLYIGDSQVVEGSFFNPNEAVFTVQLRGHADGVVTVHVETMDGTAQGVEWDGSFPPPQPSATHDYLVTAADLTFLPGETFKEFRVFAGPDVIYEPDETFYALLSSAQGAEIGDGSGVATILNDDPAPGFQLGEIWVREDGETAFFQVSLSGELTVPATVSFATRDGSATAGSDYEATSGTLTFAPGERFKLVEVPVFLDLEFELDESFSLVLSDPVNAGILVGEAEAHILDSLPTLSVSGTSVVEGDSGSTDAVFTVTLSRAAPVDVTVFYQTYPLDLSTFDLDFEVIYPEVRQLTILAGETSGTIAVPVFGDLQQEFDERFSLSLFNPANAELAVGYAYATIVNDDPGGVFSVGNAEVTESEDGDVQAVFTVTLNGALPEQTASVKYYTYARYADADDGYSTLDFAHTGGTLTFGPGVTQQTFAVTVHDDLWLESDEDFLVYLTEPQGALIDGVWATGIIHDNEPLPALSVGDTAVGERGPYAEVYVSLSDQFRSAIGATIEYTTVDGTAQAGVDYVPISGTATIGGLYGGWGFFQIPIIDNDVEQPNRSFFFRVTSADGAVIEDGEAEIVIMDDDQPVSVSISDAGSIYEGNSFFDVRLATFTLTLSAPANHFVTVDVSTEDGTAQGVAWDGSFPPPAPGPTHDYISGSGTITFAPGETVKVVQTYIGPDTAVEPDENFFANLSNAIGATIADGRGEAVILNDDAPPGLVNSDAFAMEFEGQDSFAYFNVFLTMPLEVPVTVDYTTVDGSATAGSDYEAVSGTLTFAPGETAQTVTVRVFSDSLTEGDETFSLALSNPVNAPVLWATGTALIQDLLPSLSIGDATVVEGDSGTTEALFPVHLSFASELPVTVNWFTSPITAMEDVDYAGTSKVFGELVIPAGGTSGTITVAVNGDTQNELDETFLVFLTGAVNASVKEGMATGTIIDDDAGGLLAISDASVVEGDEGETQMVFTVTLAGRVADETVQVDYLTLDGVAESDGRFGQPDYLAAGGTLTFAPGVDEQTIAVTVLGDTQLEFNETFYLRLFGASNAVLADDSGYGTIVDDELRPEVLVYDAYQVIEGDDSDRYAVFYLSMFPAYLYGSGGYAQVFFSTVDGTAHAGEDYQAIDGSVTVTGFDLTPVFIPLIGDTIEEGEETFSIVLTATDGNARIVDAEAQATILDDDAPLFLSVSDTQAVEGSLSGLPFPGQVNYAFFTLTLAHPTDEIVTVDFSTQDGSATGVVWDGSFPPPMPDAARDYIVTSGTATFYPGETTQYVAVPIGPDRAIEHDETFFLNLGNVQGALLGDAQGVATILDDDPLYLFSRFVDPAAEEGSSARFEVWLAEATDETVSVDFTTADLSALAGSDYQQTSGTLVFAPGETFKTIDVPVLADSELEGEETFLLAFDNVVNATPGNGAVEGRIASQLPHLSAAAASVAEGDEGTTELVFTVSLSHAAAVDVTVDYQTFGASAEAFVDFTPASGSLTIAAGETSASIAIEVYGDTQFELDEELVLQLANPVNADLTQQDSTASGTILNDDITVSILNTSVQEGDGGYRAALFTVVLSNPLAEAFTVDFATQDGTATAGTDYVALDGTLTFAPGETSKQFTIPVFGDFAGEQEESFQVALSSPSGEVVLYGDVASAFIVDEDPALYVLDSYVTENIFDGGGSANYFRVYLIRGDRQDTVTVEYELVDGSAQAGSDYQPVSGVLVFEPGNDFQYVSFILNDDDSYEPEETLFLRLSNPIGASIVDGEGLATVIDNDDPPVASVFGNWAYEEAGAIEAFITLSAPSGFPVSVSYTTEDWTASAGEDYVPVSGELVFAPGESVKSILVQIVDDALFEQEESFRFVLTGADGAFTGADVADLVIGNTDPRPRLDISSVDMAEDALAAAGARFTVSLDAPAGVTVSVGYHTLDVSAQAGSDYLPRSGVLVFLAGETEKTITVPVIGDAALESDEVFVVVLDHAVNAWEPPYSGQALIRNDDYPPTISIGDTVVLEGTGGQFTMAAFPVALSAPSATPVSVNFFAIPETATAGADFAALNGTLQFMPGQTSLQVLIPVVPDGLEEPDETFLVRLTGPLGAVLARDTARARIVDDDQPAAIAWEESAEEFDSAFRGAGANFAEFDPGQA